MAIGTLFHLALAQHYSRMKQEQEGKNPNEFMDPVESVRLVAQVQGTEEHVANVAETYEAYKRRYWQDLHERRIFAVEVLFDGRLEPSSPMEQLALLAMERHDPDWNRLTGRVDLMFQDLGGQLWAEDHKCVTAETMVLTPSGPAPVSSLLGREEEWACAAWSADKGEAVWSDALPPEDAGVQDVYTLALSDGTEEKYGHRHPILTERGWKKVCDITPGEWVAVAQPPEFGEKDVPDDALRVLGLALSDGGRATGNDSYVISAKDPRIRAYLTEALDRLGDPWSSHRQRGEEVGVRLRVGGRALGLIEALGIKGSLSVEKLFPSELLALHSRQVGLLLGSLWEGDGAAYLGTPRPSGKRPVRIMFSSRSRSLAEGVRHLLLQSGMLSNITTSRAAGKPYYQTVIVGQKSKERFLRLALSGLMDCPISAEGGRLTRSGRPLEGFGALLAEVKRGRNFREEAEHPAWDYEGRGRRRNPWWEEGVRWVEVRQNKMSGQERCYDIEVPGFHTFLTGSCVVTHNTSVRLQKGHKEYFSISGQMLGYEHICRQRHPELVGFKINLIQHAQRGEPKFDRLVLPRRDALAAQFVDRAIDIEQSIARIKAENRPVDQWPKAMSELVCYHRYGPCDHIAKCRMGPNAKKAGGWSWEG